MIQIKFTEGPMRGKTQTIGPVQVTIGEHGSPMQPAPSFAPPPHSSLSAHVLGACAPFVCRETEVQFALHREG